MKKVITLFAAVLLTATVWAQSPEKMSYQAVIRDASDNLVTSQTVGMQISILQGSESGTAVYTETQTPTTNANGLVSIEIGEGTTSDNFSSIDWANGIYFIKTEIDPTGGTSYTITGTSQLLSVPYALHAKTAESVTGTITESDPVYVADSATIKQNIEDWNASVAKTISAIDTTNWNQKLDSYTESDPVYAADSARITANISTNQQAIIDTASQIRADLPTIITYSVGDFAQGGIVFWIDETGQHGLVCAKEDQDGGSGIQWYNGSYTNTEAFGDGVYAGEMNTMLTIVNQGSSSNDYAAGVCANYTVTESGVTYGDWYLPSKYELSLMYTNKATIDATATANSGSCFASAYYWSSTEYSTNFAWRQSFGSGGQGTNVKDGDDGVRAVRAF